MVNMGLKSIVDKGWNKVRNVVDTGKDYVKEYVSRAANGSIGTKTKLFIAGVGYVFIVACPGPTPVGPDSPPYFVSGSPSAEVTTTKIGNSHTVKGTAKDPDGDSFKYKTFKDGVQVNDTNEYTFTIDKKGMTRIDVVAYNALSDTLTKYFSAKNQSPIVQNFNSEINEEGRGSKAISDLATDPDGDQLTPTIISANGLSAYFTADSLIYTAIANFIGSGDVNYGFSDGEATITGIGTINVKAVKPTLGALADIVKNEDEPEVGSTEQTLNVNDPNNNLEELTYEITQTNSDLIRLGFNDDKTALVIKQIKTDGNGSSDITVKITDPQENKVEKSFRYTLNPMTDIKGRILDSDTWEPNNALKGFVIIKGDTTWADDNNEYNAQIMPTNKVDIEAGYRSLDKTQPMSFITTAREIAANNDQSDVDINGIHIPKQQPNARRTEDNGMGDELHQSPRRWQCKSPKHRNDR